MSAHLHTISIVVAGDSEGDASYLEQEGFEDRLAQFRAGDFDFCGVMVEAELHIPSGEGHIIQHIRTPGLWSIESDSGEDYFRSVADDEIVTLREMLTELCVPVEVILGATGTPLVYR